MVSLLCVGAGCTFSLKFMDDTDVERQIWNEEKQKYIELKFRHPYF